MTTNIERLKDALTKVDDSHYLHLDEYSLQVDGYYEIEPLEGALATAFPSVESIFTEQPDPHAMYLRTVWASGTTASGREFEVAQSGVNVILTLGNWDDPKRSITEVRLNDLVKAWLTSKGES